MGVTETLRILLTILLSTACIQIVRLFGVYDVRWPFLAEIHTAPLKRFVPSSVLQAVRALRNAPAASAVFLAGVAPVTVTTLALSLMERVLLVPGHETPLLLQVAWYVLIRGIGCNTPFAIAMILTLWNFD